MEKFHTVAMIHNRPGSKELFECEVTNRIFDILCPDKKAKDYLYGNLHVFREGMTEQVLAEQSRSAMDTTPLNAYGDPKD